MRNDCYICIVAGPSEGIAGWASQAVLVIQPEAAPREAAPTVPQPQPPLSPCGFTSSLCP